MQGSFLDCKHCKTETINIYTVLSPAQCSFPGWGFGGTNRNIKSRWIPSCNIYSVTITKHVCAENCRLWPCSTRTRIPAMRPSLVISSPCSSHVFYTPSGAPNIHQKQLRRNDARVSVLLCELSPVVPRTVDWKVGGGRKSIKNTTAMLPCGLTEMWHREELDFCGFMFPWPFKRERRKQIQLLLPVRMLKVQSKCNTLAPEVWEQVSCCLLKSRESWGVKII